MYKRSRTQSRGEKDVDKVHPSPKIWEESKAQLQKDGYIIHPTSQDLGKERMKTEFIAKDEEGNIVHVRRD